MDDDDDDADDDVDSGAGNVRLVNHVSARVLKGRRRKQTKSDTNENRHWNLGAAAEYSSATDAGGAL